MNEIDRRALADILRTRRGELKLSAREVARRAGVDAATINLVEHAKITHPRVETIRAVAAVLGVPVADIYAATHWLDERDLPSLLTYMRAKYDGELSEEDLAALEHFVERLRTSGPRPGQDE